MPYQFEEPLLSARIIHISQYFHFVMLETNVYIFCFSRLIWHIFLSLCQWQFVILFQEMFQELLQNYPNLYCCPTILGTLTKLRKTNITFVMSNNFRDINKIAKNEYYLRQVYLPLCLSTRLPLDVFSWGFIFEYFRKYVEKIQVALKYDKKKRVLLHEDRCTLYFAKFFLE